MRIRIVNKSRHQSPGYSTEYYAGMDLRANIEGQIMIEPPESSLNKTGLFVEIPVGYEAQIRPGNGLAINKSISVPNSPGTIYADYREEICVILVNFYDKKYAVKDGDRIGQMVIARHERVEWEVVDELVRTERGAGGFGHTGKE